jgi:hypothetical protein
MTSYELQCLTCGATHTLSAAEVPDGPDALANRSRECSDCALHGRPRFPLWRWRRVDLGTPAEQAAGRLWARGLVVRLRAQYRPPA